MSSVLLDSEEESNRNEEFQRLREYVLNKCCCGYEKNDMHCEYICLNLSEKSIF